MRGIQVAFDFVGIALLVECAAVGALAKGDAHVLVSRVRRMHDTRHAG